MFLILFYPLTTDRIVGTDIFHAMILLLVTGLAQIGVGNVDLWMVASLLMGSIPGVLLGSQLTVKAPTRVLRSLPRRRALPERPRAALQGLGAARLRRRRPRGRLVPSTERRDDRRADHGRIDRCSSS